MWHSIIILKNVKYNLIRMADIEKVMVYFPKEIANKLKKKGKKIFLKRKPVSFWIPIFRERNWNFY